MFLGEDVNNTFDYVPFSQLFEDRFKHKIAFFQGTSSLACIPVPFNQNV